MATPTTVRPQGISKKFFIATIAVVALVGFVVGTRSDSIMSVVAPLVGMKAPAGTIDLQNVQNTYKQLVQNYDGDLDTQKMIDGASRGLVAAAGDRYTVFMDAREAKEFNNELSGDIGGGIGAEIGVRGDQPTIVRVLPGNPAAKEGLLAGDTIVAVNDTSVIGKTSSDVAKLIRGEDGTTVKLSIARDGQMKLFTVTRKVVTNPSVYSDVKGDVGRLTISRFDAETGRLARQAAQQFKAKNVKSVILDLRGNGGGYLEAAQDVAGLWLDNKVVVSERTGGKVVDELRSGSDTVLQGLPTVVLVDDRSASASEIVAGALQDNGAAKLVGVKTFGKGTVQKVLNLGAGTQLKVTIARWYTPNGKNITKEGITPDQKVVLTPEQVNAGKDPQMAAALKKLN